MGTQVKLTKELVQKVIDTVNAGLTRGKGEAIPGRMCVEAAVCYAYGIPHSDHPPCVGESVRDFKVVLNDAKWSSNKARAKGMLKLSIAQLNSNSINQEEFNKRLIIKIVNKIISQLTTKYTPELAEQFKVVSNMQEVMVLCGKLSGVAEDIGTANGDGAFGDNGWLAAWVAADYARMAAGATDYVHSISPMYAGYAATYAARSLSYTNRDEILTQAAGLCLEVLQELKSPGCEYLYLIKTT